MLINTNNIVSITEANQNFSRVARMVDENGSAIILKNNTPRYMVVNFSEYDKIQTARQKLVAAATDSVIVENMEALREFAGNRRMD